MFHFLSTNQILTEYFKPAHEILVLIAYASGEASDEHVQTHNHVCFYCSHTQNRDINKDSS